MGDACSNASELKGVRYRMKAGKQTTLRTQAAVSGIGVHSGLPATLTMLPADPDTGIVFVRLGQGGQPDREIRADVRAVTATEFATVLGDANGPLCSTAEHVLAALSGLGIDNCIIELDGRPAWSVFLERLGLPPTASEGDTIPIGALAEVLPADLADEYGNGHILRVVTHHDEGGEIIYAARCPEGTELWLTVRDEDLIFRDMDRLLEAMQGRHPGRHPVAVFHADCLARGRRLFDRVIKEELVHRMQQPFASDGTVPPWFGMYGFGEYAMLGGRNAYHNYTTALAALYRTA